MHNQRRVLFYLLIVSLLLMLAACSKCTLARSDKEAYVITLDARCEQFYEELNAKRAESKALDNQLKDLREKKTDIERRVQAIQAKAAGGDMPSEEDANRLLKELTQLSDASQSVLQKQASLSEQEVPLHIAFYEDLKKAERPADFIATADQIFTLNAKDLDWQRQSIVMLRKLADILKAQKEALEKGDDASDFEPQALAAKNDAMLLKAEIRTIDAERKSLASQYGFRSCFVSFTPGDLDV